MIHVHVNRLFKRKLIKETVRLLDGRGCESCAHSFYSNMKGCYLHKTPRDGFCRKWEDMGESGIKLRSNVRNMGR